MQHEETGDEERSGELLIETDELMITASDLLTITPRALMAKAVVTKNINPHAIIK